MERYAAESLKNGITQTIRMLQAYLHIMIVQTLYRKQCLRGIFLKSESQAVGIEIKEHQTTLPHG